MSPETIANIFASQPAKRRTGTVAGTQEISEVQAMIQRYLELAASALKETKPEGQHSK